MIFIILLAIFCVFFQQLFATPNGDRLHFSDRREMQDSEYRAFDRQRPDNGGGSNIEDVFKIPIAVIKGTSAAAQAFSPQNTQTIQSLFNIPVTTLDAVGNYIKDSRPRRMSNNNNNLNNNNDDNFGSQGSLSLSEQRRENRRQEILKLREEERVRRRLMEEEKFFHHGGHHHHHSNLDVFSTLVDLLIGGGGHHGSNLFGSHGHGHHSKPTKRPLKPSKPGHHGSHGSFGNRPSGNGHYEVHEQVDDGPGHFFGILPWLQTATNFQSDEYKIENKIAPGSEIRYD